MKSISGKNLCAILEKKGWQLKKIHGSHHVYMKVGRKERISVPVHGSIVKFSFHAKKENIVGLQIADLCAYPLARSILNPDEPYVPFQIIRDKIYCDKKGEYKGWGLKIFQ